MPNRTNFTGEEDAILLSTVGAPADEVNRQLTERGFPARTANAIKTRRHHLRQEQSAPEVTGEGAALITGLLARRESVEGRLASLEAEAERTREALGEVDRLLLDAIETFRDDLSHTAG